MKSSRPLIYAVLLAVILIAVRLPALLHPVLDVDEAIYGLFARIWFDGGIPYLDAVETKPLGIYLFYGLIFSIFGKFNMIAVHAATIIIVALTAYVIYLIASALYSRSAGFWAALFYVVFTTAYIPKLIATEIEIVMLLPVCLQFYWWLKFENENKTKFAVASGLAFSTACLFKYQAGMNLVIFILYLGIVKPVSLKNVRYAECWKGFARFVLGAAIPPIIMIAYLAYAGALDDFLFWNVTGNAQYISEGTASINFLHQISARVLPYVASTALIWVLSAICIILLFRKGRNETEGALKTAQEWLIVLWFVLSIVPVFTGFRFYGHYFLLLIPAMSVLSSKIADSVWLSPSRAWPKILIVFWIALPAAGFLTARFFIPEINRTFHEDNLSDYKPLAQYAAERTEPGDKIIAWGFAPMIYWESQRLPATRFFWSDVLTGRVPGHKGEQNDAEKYAMPKAWEMFLSDIEKNRPVYFIDTAPANLHDYKDFPATRYPALREYLKKNYREEANVGGALFYRRVD